MTGRLIPHAALAFALAAGQAAALTPIPECHDPGVGDYSVAWHANGFAAYSVYDPDSRLILEDCVGDRVLSMAPRKAAKPEDGWVTEEALRKAVLSALESDQPYTMGQIEAIARKAGAMTKTSKAADESCACRKYGQ